MKGDTLVTLQELERADWFRAVGQKDTKAAIVLDSWSKAIASCSSRKWEDLLLEAANQYSEKIFQRSKERFNQWNIIMREMKPITEALVMRKTLPIVLAHKVPKSFEDSVKWDILHLAMESEFADIHPPGFYASQAYWYMQGHFPCGWDGKFPDGKLIIY
jgi:hypothetical protein